MASAPGSSTTTVLIVDDEPAIRKLVAALLRQAGYSTFEAADAAEALTISSEIDGSIDVLVTDVVMPKMDGITLAEHVVALHPNAKVLFISGFYDVGTLPVRKREHASAFLAKPFSAPELLSAVQALIGEPKILAVDV